MILAAGRGQRLRPLTDYLPKPLLQVGGESLVSRHLRRLSAAGVAQVVINTAWLGALIRAHVADGRQFGLSVVWSDEGPGALETGGGVQRALPLLGVEPFIVVNGDVYTDFDFARLNPPVGDDLATLLLVPNPTHNRNGDFALTDGRVAQRGERLTYSGIAVLSPALFAGVPPGRFSLAPLFREAIAEGRVAGQFHQGAWFDTGSIAGIRAARAFAGA